jgi:hypothetical protein
MTTRSQIVDALLESSKQTSDAKILALHRMMDKGMLTMVQMDKIHRILDGKGEVDGLENSRDVIAKILEVLDNDELSMVLILASIGAEVILLSRAAMAKWALSESGHKDDDWGEV